MIEEHPPADRADVVEAPVTVRQALERATRRLTHAGIDRGALDASLLLAEACDTDRLGLYTDPDRSLSASQCRTFQDLLERRARREPVAYILGRREFYGLDFGVTPDALIPRPETELLVERAIAWIEARARTRPQPLLADIGTGSGAIAVSVAHVCRVGRWIATDVSEAALEVARANPATASPTGSTSARAACSNRSVSRSTAYAPIPPMSPRAIAIRSSRKSANGNPPRPSSAAPMVWTMSAN